MKNYADFLMVLSPPENITHTISNYKAQVTQLIGMDDGMDTIANIAIKNMPRQKPYLIEPILANVGAKLLHLPPALLTIDGFDYFTHGTEYKTVYAKIRSTPQTTQWFKELKKQLIIKEFLVPHIPIARNIPLKFFDKLWPHFKDVQWVDPFRVNTLTVLSREAFAPFATWEVFSELPLAGKSEAQQQPVNLKKSLLKAGNYTANQQISLF